MIADVHTGNAGDTIGWSKISGQNTNRCGFTSSIWSKKPKDFAFIHLKRQIIEIRELIRILGGTRTIILSSHILPEVSQLCEKVIILNKGRLVAVDTPDNLDKNLGGVESITVSFTGESNSEGILNQLSILPGVTSLKLISKPDTLPVRVMIETSGESDVRPQLAKMIVDESWSLLELHRQTRTLEDIFIQLVTQETLNESNLADN